MKTNLEHLDLHYIDWESSYLSFKTEDTIKDWENLKEFLDFSDLDRNSIYIETKTKGTGKKKHLNVITMVNYAYSKENQIHLFSQMKKINQNEREMWKLLETKVLQKIIKNVQGEKDNIRNL